MDNNEKTTTTDPDKLSREALQGLHWLVDDTPGLLRRNRAGCAVGVISQIAADAIKQIEQLQGENKLLRHQQANARRASENTRCSGCGEVLDGDEPTKFFCPLCGDEIERLKTFEQITLKMGGLRDSTLSGWPGICHACMGWACQDCKAKVSISLTGTPTGFRPSKAASPAPSPTCERLTGAPRLGPNMFGEKLGPNPFEVAPAPNAPPTEIVFDEVTGMSVELASSGGATPHGKAGGDHKCETCKHRFSPSTPCQECCHYEGMPCRFNDEPCYYEIDEEGDD